MSSDTHTILIFVTLQTSIPITASAAGIIVELFVEDGEKVEKGDKLFKIQVGGTMLKLS